MSKQTKKKDRTWIFDTILWFGEVLIYIPRLIGRFIKDIFFN